METKEMKIVVPEGYEIDEENSTFKCIKFKPIKSPTYFDAAFALYTNNTPYVIGRLGEINKTHMTSCYDPMNCLSSKQCEKLIAINKLINVATYLNEGWKPDWTNTMENKWYIICGYEEISFARISILRESFVYFKTEELAKQAVDMLGEDIIRLAFSTDL